MLVGRSCGFSFIQRSRFVTEARQDRKGIVAARNPWVFIIRRSSLTSDYPQLQPGRKKFSMPCPRKQNKTSYFSAVFFWWRRPKYVACYPLFLSFLQSCRSILWRWWEQDSGWDNIPIKISHIWPWAESLMASPSVTFLLCLFRAKNTFLRSLFPFHKLAALFMTYPVTR